VTWSHTSRLLVTAAAAVVVVAGLRAASGIVGPVVLALALTIVFYPMRPALQRRLPPWATSVVIVVCAYALVLALVLSLVVGIGQLATLVPTYAPEINAYVEDGADLLKRAGVDQEAVVSATGALDSGRLAGLATDVLSGVLGILSDLFFLVTLLLFLAFDSAAVAALASRARDEHAAFVDAMSSFAQGTRTYLGVSAVFGLIVAVIDTVLLWAMGVPGAFVWGVLAFVTNFIPNIGFVIGLVPPALIALLDSGPGLMVAVIVMYSVVNLVIQSVIQPRVVGNAVGLSTTLTFISLVFWAWVLGPIGALLAIPMSLLFKAVLVEMDPAASWLGPLISGHAGPGPVPVTPASSAADEAAGPGPA
jgi:AI-2 transport protein TqsA